MFEPTKKGEERPSWLKEKTTSIREMMGEPPVILLTKNDTSCLNGKRREKKTVVRRNGDCFHKNAYRDDALGREVAARKRSEGKAT